LTVVIFQRRARQKLVRRDRITTAALGLFRARGFESTTVEEIAERADVAKGTFFNYFPTKQGVLAEYYSQLASEFLLLARQGRRGTALHRLHSFFVDVETRLRQEGSLLEVLFHEVFARPDLIQLDAGMEREISNVYRQHILAGIERGELRDVDIDLAVRTIIDLWSATLRRWIDGKRRFSLAEDLNAKLTLLFGGLAVPRRAGMIAPRRSD
jgi:TetR/AcrR family transcriptional regulator, cholesterol catabolism regulator